MDATISIHILNISGLFILKLDKIPIGIQSKQCRFFRLLMIIYTFTSNTQTIFRKRPKTYTHTHKFYYYKNSITNSITVSESFSSGNGSANFCNKHFLIWSFLLTNKYCGTKQNPRKKPHQCNGVWLIRLQLKTFGWTKVNKNNEQNQDQRLSFDFWLEPSEQT